MADQVKYVNRVFEGQITVGEPGTRVLLSREAALELFKQLSKELGFDADFTCRYAGRQDVGPCSGPTVFEHNGYDGESTWYDYLCAGHVATLKKEQRLRDDEFRDMLEIPKGKTHG